MLRWTTLSFLALAVGVCGQAVVNTPSGVVECEPTQFSWSGGTPPYFLTIVQAGSPSTILENLGQLSTTTFTWTADLPPNTAFSVAIKDSTGVQSFSGTATVAAGTITSCSNSTAGNGTSSTSTATSAISSVSSSLSSALSSASSIVSSATSKASSAVSSATSPPSSTSTSKPNSGLQVSPTGLSGLLSILALLFLRA